MRFGALLCDQDEFTSSGFMYLDGDVSYISNLGKIPNDALLLSNLAVSPDHQNVVTGVFVGLSSSHSILRWSAEMGDLVFKENGDQRIRELKNKESARAASPQKSVKNIGRLFHRMMTRLLDAGLLMDRYIPANIPNWMYQSWCSDAWRASQNHIPDSLKNSDQQASAIDYWVKRSLSPRNRVAHITFSWDRIRLMRHALMSPLPFGQWSLQQSLAVHNLDKPCLVESVIQEIPEEWSNWWKPGSSGITGKRGKRIRNLFAHPEWLFMENIGVVNKPESYYIAEAYGSFEDLFPKAFAFMNTLNPCSWVDQKIATCLGAILESSDGFHQKIPARLWVRSRSMIQQMLESQWVENSLSEAGLSVNVTGYGSGKLALRVLEKDKDFVVQWALLHGLYMVMQLEKTT